MNVTEGLIYIMILLFACLLMVMVIDWESVMEGLTGLIKRVKGDERSEYTYYTRGFRDGKYRLIHPDTLGLKRGDKFEVLKYHDSVHVIYYLCEMGRASRESKTLRTIEYDIGRDGKWRLTHVDSEDNE